MFTNRFVDALSADPSRLNQPRQVRDAHYSFVCCQKAPNPKLIHCAPQMAELLGFEQDFLQSEQFLDLVSGRFPAEQSYASRYGGHQFGTWAGQLGDGRAINLGEIKGTDDHYWTLQLKGAGPTPYARTADGYAVLRSSLREYICSEAMHALGVPTTRALSLCTTGQEVVRDMFYDGRPQKEQGAIVCRVSRSFLRFGHYEILAISGDLVNLERLLAYTIEEFFPDLKQDLADNPERAWLKWFARVQESTIHLIVHWLRVGFVHGVMNTDNMSILGETIDYGPYGWIDGFDPNWTPNTTDVSGRYSFAMQARVAQWNLWCLANAIACLFDKTEGLNEILSEFESQFQKSKLAMMQGKLGLSASQPQDDILIADLETWLSKAKVDMTLFFQCLLDINDGTDDPFSVIDGTFYEPEPASEAIRHEFTAWAARYSKRLLHSGSEDHRRIQMEKHNPVCIPRNYLTQLAIEGLEQGDDSVLESLFQAVTDPYRQHEDKQEYYRKRPAWALDKPGCSRLSCSS